MSYKSAEYGYLSATGVAEEKIKGRLSVRQSSRKRLSMTGYCFLTDFGGKR